MKKRALIFGITGQVGSYLAELLLEKDYDVYGMVRRVAVEDNRYSRISHIQDRLKLYSGTIESYSQVIDTFDKIRPDECYHLAAQSFVKVSFEEIFSTFKTNIDGTLHVLEALRKKWYKCKLLFSATSEMFGRVLDTPQNEQTPFYPRSPYAVSKVAGFDLVRNYREAYNLFACSSICFNMESPRRGSEFVTRKITQTLGAIKGGETNILVLGNLDSQRDFGYAKEYVEAMHKMLQGVHPEDYCISTGECHSIREFLDLAFELAGMKYVLVDLHALTEDQANQKTEGLKNDKSTIYVVQHPKFYRPSEVDILVGDSTKIKDALGWEVKTNFKELVKLMVYNDLKK